MAVHLRSHSQEIAELGPKPRVDFTHYIECFLHSLVFQLVFLALSLDSLTDTNPKEEAQEAITDVSQVGLVSDWSFLHSVPTSVLQPGISCQVRQI